MANKMKRPNYQDFDGFTISGALSPEVFRSAVNYKPKPGQLFIVTYPKCGTTWMQYIVSLIFSKGQPVDDFGKIMRNSPFLEVVGADAVDFMNGPGAIKVHLPFNLTPYSPDAKYIYVARNPRDCCISFFYHTKNAPLNNFSDGTFDEFFELFIKGRTDYGDYFDHLLSWYEHKDDPNVYLVTYEELKADTKNQVMKIAKFMGDEHYDNLINNPDTLENVLKFSSFDYMKNNINDYMKNYKNNLSQIPENVPLPSGLKALQKYIKDNDIEEVFTGEFIRKGIIGDWKNHFSPEQEKRMQERIKEKTAGSDVMKLWNTS